MSSGINRENYRAYNAINYSQLARLDKNPSSVVEDREVWNDGMAFGDLVDLMLFDASKIEEQYYVSKADRKPSGTAKLLADWILENYDIRHVDKNMSGETVLMCHDEWIEVLLSKALDLAKDEVGKSTSFKKYGGLSYLKEQVHSRDKTVVTKELYDKATKAKITLSTHDFTSGYFRNSSRHVDLKFQYPILWDASEWDDEIKWPSKSLLDILIVNHDKKVLVPVDLKTTSRSARFFESSIIKWRYYLQASYYFHAAEYLTLDEDSEYYGYDVWPFRFIVLDQSNLDTPYVYNCSKEMMAKGRDGGVIKRYDNEVRGWIQLIKDLKWHERNNKWEYPRDIYMSNGVKELNIFE